MLENALFNVYIAKWFINSSKTSAVIGTVIFNRYSLHNVLLLLLEAL